MSKIVKVEITTEEVRVYNMTDQSFEQFETMMDDEGLTDEDFKDFLDTQLRIEHEETSENFCVDNHDLLEDHEAETCESSED